MLTLFSSLRFWIPCVCWFPLSSPPPPLQPLPLSLFCSALGPEARVEHSQLLRKPKQHQEEGEETQYLLVLFSPLPSLSLPPPSPWRLFSITRLPPCSLFLVSSLPLTAAFHPGTVFLEALCANVTFLRALPTSENLGGGHGGRCCCFSVFFIFFFFFGQKCSCFRAGRQSVNKSWLTVKSWHHGPHSERCLMGLAWPPCS